MIHLNMLLLHILLCISACIPTACWSMHKLCNLGNLNRKGNAQKLPSVDPILAACLEINRLEKYYTHPFIIDGDLTPVTSFFNHDDDPQAITLSLSRTKNKCRTFPPGLDLRPLELHLCRKALASQPYYIKNRGLLGLAAGAAMGITATAAFYETQKQAE